MFINKKYSIHLLFVIVFTKCYYTIASKRGLIPVIGTHSIIYTSPLSIGSNSSNLLKTDFSKPPDCITTLRSDSSWVLVDLGFIVQGIVQLRLYGDNFNDETHKYLSNVEIKMARILPLNSIADFHPKDNINFKLCGNTGTVFKETFDAVVDCKSEFNVRWILLNKKQILNLCHLGILRNAIQPQCFYQLTPENKFYTKASSNLEVFKSARHLTSLECFQNCDSETTCEGVAFVPMSPDRGICQLLRVKTSTSNLFCDIMCQLSINVCHLGQKIKVGSTNKDDIIRLPSINKNSYLLSVEITGEILCNQENCGETVIYILDANGKNNFCGKIDPLLFRVLSNNVFICEQSIKDPIELKIRTRTDYPTYSFYFRSIDIRIVEERSFILDVVKYFLKSNLYQTSTRSTKTTQQITNQSFKASSEFNIKSSSSSFNKIMKTSVFLDQTALSVLKISTNSISIAASNVNQKHFPVFKRSSIITKIKPISTNYITKSESMTSTNNNNLRITSSSLLILSKLNTKLISPSTNIQNVIYSQKYDTKRNIGEKVYVKSTPTTLFNKSKTTSENNINLLLNLSTNFQSVNQSSAPYIWIILLIFVTILITVTIIVIIVTVLESRRKRKEWDIPPNGLFPLDHISEPLTMQSSLHESTLRK